jgi:pyridoxamine 5'-phosphate oxidase
VDVERGEYASEGLTERELPGDPLTIVRSWVSAAQARQGERGDVPEPAAMSVATVDAHGRPDVRTVLLRFLDARGPGFVTDLRSAKSVAIAHSGHVAAALTWPSMYRAIRFRGAAVPVPRDEVAAYFVGRPWGSRISAWASNQSLPVADRATLVAAYDAAAARFPDTGSPDDVPVPEHWGGWRIACDEVELWAGRRDRLHDRLVFVRVAPGDLSDATAWRVERRQP